MYFVQLRIAPQNPKTPECFQLIKLRLNNATDPEQLVLILIICNVFK